VRLADRQFVVVYRNHSGFQVNLPDRILPDNKTAVNLQEMTGWKPAQNFMNGHSDHEGLVARGNNTAVVFY
jgi:hypothetical protein